MDSAVTHVYKSLIFRWGLGSGANRVEATRLDFSDHALYDVSVTGIADKKLPISCIHSQVDIMLRQNLQL